jgi:hypothetical protein
MTVNGVGVGRVAPFLQAGDIDSGGYWRALLQYKWMLLIAASGASLAGDAGLRGTRLQAVGLWCLDVTQMPGRPHDIQFLRIEPTASAS